MVNPITVFQCDMTCLTCGVPASASNTNINIHFWKMSNISRLAFKKNDVLFLFEFFPENKNVIIYNCLTDHQRWKGSPHESLSAVYRGHDRDSGTLLLTNNL